MGAAARCGGVTAPPASAPPPPVASAAAPPSPAPDAGADAAADAAPAPPRPTLEVLPAEPALDPAPHVEIKFPFAEQHIAAAKASSYHVRLKVEHWPERDVELVLDDFRPRPLAELGEPVTLGALVPADRELEPGEHILFAFAERKDGITVKPASASSLQPFGVVHFWVGPRGTSQIDMHEPMIVLSEPRGTFNGDAAADAVRVDYYVLGAPPESGDYRVAVSVDGAGVHGEIAADRPQSLAVHGLPSGDFRVTAQLLAADGKPTTGGRARAARVITVNRDLPAESRIGRPRK